MGYEVRRDPRRFEPPPWEQEAFEALARKKAEEQEALDVLAALNPPAAEPVDLRAEAMAAEVLAAKSVVEARAEDEPEVVKGTEAAEPAKAPSEPVRKPAAGHDDPHIKAMLMELSREETTDTRQVRLVARGAAVVTAIVGLGMLLGGVTSIQKASGTTVGVMGSGALSVFGLCFAAMAVWVWVRSNRV
jgi:hypothetical protein